MRRALIAAVVLVLQAALCVSTADAVNCRRACRSTIRACIAQECNPPAFAVPRRACVRGLKAGALVSCKRSGPEACPRNRCPITPD
jgi:hypothetical protein